MASIDSPSIPRSFRHIDGALLRAVPCVPSDFDLPVVTGEAADLVPHWCRWLRRVWDDQDVAAAIEVASPVLARRMEDLIAGRPIGARQLHRMVLSVVRYLARMRSRATPFGMFAGVAAARFGDEAVVTWSQPRRALADADAGWLAEVITRLESCSPLLGRLRIVASNMCIVRGDRLVIQDRPHTRRDGRPAYAEVSVRYTPAVQKALEAAHTPVRFAHVAACLAGGFPGTPGSVIESMLISLVSKGVLLSELHAPGTVPDALGHLVAQLTAVHAADIPEVAPVIDGLCHIHDALRRHNLADSPELAARQRGQLRAAMTTLITTSTVQPLKIDLRLGGEITVPAAVAHEAELAATALIRLTPFPAGAPAWLEYHDRFAERYGIGVLVPVTDLVDPGSGLGFPAGYRGSDRGETPRILTARDTKLLALAQGAMADGQREVVLGEGEIRELENDDSTRIWVPSHAEVCMEVCATSTAALTRGDFTLAVTAAPRAAGTVTGRFVGALEPAEAERMVAALAALPGGEAEASVVQVSFPPLVARMGNVVRGQAFMPEVIALGEHRPHSARVIPLEDLSVGSDGNSLFLMRVSAQRRVEPTVFHALEFRVNTPPLARFLCEIARAACAVYGVFDWGAASVLPWLPRVRYRRTILSPAQWRLLASDLPGRSASWAEWVTSLAAWQRRFRMPATVQLREADRRLELDLGQEAHRAVLRSQLDGAGHAVLTEAPDPKERGWLDGRASELVVPLVSTSAASQEPENSKRVPHILASRDHGHPPGRPPWLFAKVYTPAQTHSVILRDHLAELLAAWDTQPEWWFVRYRDQRGPHLRLRIRVADQHEYADAAHHVGCWVEQLRRSRLASEVVFDTYYPEIGRYGPGRAMALAEAAFAADSRAVLLQLAAAQRGAVPAEAITAASLAQVAVAFTGSAESGLRWLTRHPVPPTAVPRDTAALAVRLTLAALSTSAHESALNDLPGVPKVRAAWHQRSNALAAYRTHLAATTIAAEPTLMALLHMHHNRMAGIDIESERTCLRLARAAALAWTGRAGEEGNNKP